MATALTQRMGQGMGQRMGQGMGQGMMGQGMMGQGMGMVCADPDAPGLSSPHGVSLPL